MIGNDIIDRLEACRKSNWRRRGFLSKIFTLSEQHIISASNDEEKFVWLLWSMKEAAYKIYNRATQVRGFFPSKLICSTNTSGNEGIVRYEGKVYYTRSVITENMIHTIAVEEENRFISIQELEDYNVLRDTSGLPFILFNNELKPVSTSHHGRFRKTVFLI